MKKIFFVSVVIAILAAFFASSHPDGLDFISEKLGFVQKGQERTAPMADYSVGFLPEGGISTSTAGFAGILITLGIFLLAAYILKKGNSGTKNKILFLCFVLLVASSPVFAARPLVTDDFYTVSQGGYELEFGYATVQNQLSLANTFCLSIKRGFTQKFDFGIEIPYTSSLPRGFNDILLHAKYRFWEASENDGFTARVDYKFNNGNLSQCLGSGDSDYGLLLIGSKIFGATKTHINIGYVMTGVNAGLQSDDYLAYACSMEHPFWGEKGDIVAECVANNAIQPNPVFIQVGARYVVLPGLKLDAGYSFGLNTNSIKNSLTAGLHSEF